VNYYEHHLGDYMRDTAHLSMMEDAAYRRLLDAYYVREKALPTDLRECCKLARAVSKAERDAVAYVLREFFNLQDDGYHQKRADEEIRRYRAKSEKARASVETRWERERERKRIEDESNTVRNTNVSATEYERIERMDTNVQIDRYERNTDDIHRAPVPSNQKPERESISRGETARARGARLDPGWVPSEIDAAWARAKRPDLDIPETIERFRDYWTAKAGADATKLDWSATWRNWVRNEKAPPRVPPRPDSGAFV
jgi:uncharacterized protein YdaU (DUF1376 family)